MFHNLHGTPRGMGNSMQPLRAKMMTVLGVMAAGHCGHHHPVNSKLPQTAAALLIEQRKVAEGDS